MGDLGGASAATACLVPGAIPDDGLDDRAAIQSALTSQKCAFLPAGVYDIDSIPFTPPGRRPYMMLEAVSAELYGAGPATVLAFRGSTGGQDWEGIRMTGIGSKLHDLSITTAAISDTAEQTHAVKIMGPVIDAQVSRVSFDHPVQVGKSGDCIELTGYNDGREIARVKIDGNDFLHCDRSGVAAHSGTTQLEIVDNHFRDVGNTDLDFEGTGDTSDVTVRHNTFDFSPGPHGTFAIQLQLIDRARVTENVLDGRGIDVYQSDDVEIDHNVIKLTQATKTAVVAIGKDSARTRILGNSISREASAEDGAVISAGPHNSGTPDHLEITGNSLFQKTSFNVISTSGIVGLDVRNNAIDYAGGSNVMSGLVALGSSGVYGIRTTDIHVAGNKFTGAMRSAVFTAGSYYGAGTLDTADNLASGPKYGIYCENETSQGAITGPIVSMRDSWPAPSCGPPGFVSIDPHGPDTPQEPGGGDGGGGGTPPAADTTAPVLSGVSLSRATFRVAKAAAKGRGGRRGTTVRFSSSEAGTLSAQVERVGPRRKLRKVAALSQPIATGSGSLALSGRTGTRRMRPGRYRLTLTARDAAGNASQPVRRAFAILPG